MIQIATLQTLLQYSNEVVIIQAPIAAFPCGTFQTVIRTWLTFLRLKGLIIDVVSFLALGTSRISGALQTINRTYFALASLLVISGIAGITG